MPIEENASLAGALSEVEIGDEIPVELYKAVAEVLLFIMRMSGRLKRAGVERHVERHCEAAKHAEAISGRSAPHSLRCHAGYARCA